MQLRNITVMEHLRPVVLCYFFSQNEDFLIGFEFFSQSLIQGISDGIFFASGWCSICSYSWS